MNTRRPLIAGAGQVTDRGGTGSGPTALTLMTESARAAAADAGTAGDALVAKVDTVAIVACLSWQAADPGSYLARELRVTPRETVRSSIGGTSPVALLADLCTRIEAGEIDVALLAGGEAVHAGVRSGQNGDQETSDEEPTRVIGEDVPASHPLELAAGLLAPVQYYPFFENAVRGRAGRDPGSHRQWLGRLWGRLAEVARENPHAWEADPPTAEEIATPGEGNRPVSFPYLKWMNANIRVNQGAALLLCSEEAADTAGLSPDRRVYVHSTALANDRWFMAERHDLARSPAIAATGSGALTYAGRSIDDVALLDLYSCFPSAVQIAATELGIDLERDERPPTVTGGLTFAGGPVNNYATHSLAAMAGRLRERPEDAGLCTAIGWYMSKHGIAVLSGEPPERPYRNLNVQRAIDALPGREAADGFEGGGEIETYTAMYSREGEPQSGTVSAVLDDGRRALARSDDPPTLASLLAEDSLGRPTEISAAEFRLP